MPELTEVKCHAGDPSQTADTLAGSGQAVVSRVRQSIAGLSCGVQQTAGMTQRLAQESSLKADD